MKHTATKILACVTVLIVALVFLPFLLSEETVAAIGPVVVKTLTIILFVIAIILGGVFGVLTAIDKHEKKNKSKSNKI